MFLELVFPSKESIMELLRKTTLIPTLRQFTTTGCLTLRATPNRPFFLTCPIRRPLLTLHNHSHNVPPKLRSFIPYIKHQQFTFRSSFHTFLQYSKNYRCYTTTKNYIASIDIIAFFSTPSTLFPC